jgi:hypothetical protein
MHGAVNEMAESSFHRSDIPLYVASPGHSRRDGSITRRSGVHIGETAERVMHAAQSTFSVSHSNFPHFVSILRMLERAINLVFAS